MSASLPGSPGPLGPPSIRVSGRIPSDPELVVLAACVLEIRFLKMDVCHESRANVRSYLRRNLIELDPFYVDMLVEHAVGYVN